MPLHALVTNAIARARVAIRSDAGAVFCASLLTLGKLMRKFSRRRSDEVGSLLPLGSGASRLGSTKGQTAVEFAMVSILFLLLIFGVIDYGWLMFAQMNVQQAVDDGGRFASTGNHSTNQSGQTLSRTQSIINTVQSEINVPGVNAQNLQISSVAGGSGSAGGPGDTVTLTLTTTMPLMTPLIGQFFPAGGYTFTASATFKNEPFDPSQTK